MLLRFSESLASITNVCNFTKFMVLNNQPCITSPTLVDLHSDEYNQGFHYYLFIGHLPTINHKIFETKSSFYVK